MLNLPMPPVPKTQRLRTVAGDKEAEPRSQVSEVLLVRSSATKSAVEHTLYTSMMKHANVTVESARQGEYEWFYSFL